MKRLSLVQIIAALCICNVYLFTCGVMGAAGVDDTAAVRPSDDDSEHNGHGTQDFLTPDNIIAPPSSTTSTTTETLNTQNFGQPSLAQRPVSSVFMPGSLTEKLPDADSVNSSSSTSSEVFGGGYVEEIPVSTIPPEEYPGYVESSTESSSQSSSAPQSTPISSGSDPEPVESSSGGETSEPPEQSSSTSSSSSSTSSSSASSSSTGSSTTSSADSSTSTSTSIPTQPNEVITDTSAANEILRVSVNGEIVSGTALDIISGIVANEVGGAFAPEAIKAQAVAAYSYVKYFNLRNNTPSAYISDASDSIKVLVGSVIGEAVYYDGEIIQATYSASSAGCTASSQNVWGTSVPYLQSVDCEFDEQYDPNYGRTKKFSASDMKSRIYNTTGISLSGDPSEWFKVEDRTEGKYVGKMSIGGYHTYIDSYGDTVTITGRVFRERIMSFDVRSSAFDISYDSDSEEFTVTTYGYGHGVGLSQNGANALATHSGWDYRQILEFYYTGTTVR